VTTRASAAATRRLRHNIVANYASAAAIGVLAVATTPLYLRLLGAEQWGLVAVCMTVQVLLAMADIGMSQSMPRAIARVAGDPDALRRSWRAYTALYGSIAAIVFTVGQIAAAPFAGAWLARAGVDAAAGELALRVLLVQFAFQFINNAHVGFWLGTEQQVRAAVRQAVFAGLRHVGVLTALFAGVQGAPAYLVPFAALAAAECIANHVAVSTTLQGIPARAIRAAELGAVIRDASVLTVGILVGTSVSQLDRWVVASTVSLESFGLYVAVASIGLAFLQLHPPVGRAFLPRLSALQVSDPAALPAMIGRCLTAVVACCVLPAAVAMAAAEPVLRLWLGDPAAAADGVLPLRLILGAVMLNALYSVVYLLILARRDDRVVVAINTFALAAALAVIAVSGPPWSAATGGAIWLAGSIAQCIGGAIWWWRRAAHPVSGPIAKGVDHGR
jgi:O-antigen/teichoic acid export membrane protein